MSFALYIAHSNNCVNCIPPLIAVHSAVFSPLFEDEVVLTSLICQCSIDGLVLHKPSEFFFRSVFYDMVDFGQVRVQPEYVRGHALMSKTDI